MQLPTCFLRLVNLVVIALLLAVNGGGLPLLQLLQGRLLLGNQLGLLGLVVSAEVEIRTTIS